METDPESIEALVLALCLLVLVLAIVLVSIAKVATGTRRILRDRYRSSCDHVLASPIGDRGDDEGLRYSCRRCDLVVRRREREWPPRCTEHPFHACSWPRCAPPRVTAKVLRRPTGPIIEGPPGYPLLMLRHWRDLGTRARWRQKDKPPSGDWGFIREWLEWFGGD